MSFEVQNNCNKFSILCDQYQYGTGARPRLSTSMVTCCELTEDVVTSNAKVGR